MQSLAFALLNVAASLLITLQNNSSRISAAVQEQVVRAASQAVQLGAQAMRGNSGFAEISHTNLWPNASQIQESLYLDYAGRRVPLGTNVQLTLNAISFGDMNSDYVDDAIVFVKTISDKNEVMYKIAVMLNQGGILFNIASVDLGSSLAVYSHSIEAEEFTVDMKAGSGARETRHYKLVGNALAQI